LDFKKLSSVYYFFLLIFLLSCATPQPVEKDLALPARELPPEKQIVPVEKPEKIDTLDYILSSWFGFHKAACSLTFDDGTVDQYVIAFPELEKRDLKATFFLITKYRRRGYWCDFQEKRTLFSWDQARELSLSGHEIGSHGKTHKDLTKKRSHIKRELRDSFIKIKKEIPLQKNMTFAWAYWRSNDKCLSVAKNYYISARSGTGIPEKYLERNGGIPHSTLNDFFEINSLAIRNGDSDRSWQNLCNRVFSEEGWFIVGFHGITDGKIAKECLGWEAIPVFRFNYILDYIEDKGFWVAPFGTVTRYIQERNSAVLSFKYSSHHSYILSLEDGLDDTIYNLPLSMKVKLPDKWNSVEIFQNGRILDHHISESSYAFFNVLPDGSNIIIKRQG